MATRTWKSNPYVGLILLVVALGAGWLTYRSVKGPPESTAYSYVLKCAHPDCGAMFEDSYPESQKPPFPCAVCGSHAYPALQCRSCGLIFPSNRSPSREPPYLCPECLKTAFPLESGQAPLDSVSPDP